MSNFSVGKSSQKGEITFPTGRTSDFTRAKTKYRDHKERIIVLLMGEKPGGVSPLVKEIMRRKLNAKVYTEYQMIEYALGIKQYVMFFERKI